MKLYYYPILILIIFSCGSNQSASNNKPSNISKANNKNIGCSFEAKTYAENNFGRTISTYSTSLSKKRHGSQVVSFMSERNPSPTVFQIQVWIDDNCKVVNANKISNHP